MFGKLGDMAGMLKQAKEMKDQMERMQAELAVKRFDGEAGAGLVRATVNGRLELVDIKIDPKAVEDVELLEDLVKSSIAAASRRAQESAAEDMKKLTGGIDPGALGKLLGAE
jgi:hypothetical protein